MKHFKMDVLKGTNTNVDTILFYRTSALNTAITSEMSWKAPSDRWRLAEDHQWYKLCTM